MGDELNKRMGRPVKPVDERAPPRTTYSCRLRKETRSTLIEAAKASGRSVSEEIEYRCEMPDRIAALEAKIDRLMEIIAPIAEREAWLRRGQSNYANSVGGQQPCSLANGLSGYQNAVG